MGCCTPRELELEGEGEGGGEGEGEGEGGGEGGRGDDGGGDGGAEGVGDMGGSEGGELEVHVQSNVQEPPAPCEPLGSSPHAFSPSEPASGMPVVRSRQWSPPPWQPNCPVHVPLRLHEFLQPSSWSLRARDPGQTLHPGLGSSLNASARLLYT